MTRFLFALLLLSFFYAGPASAENKRALIGTNFQVIPARIVDGDTFKAGRQSIRLWGFNTPEHDEPKFFAAAAKLEQLIANVRLTCHVRDMDRYGRPVAQCRLPNGRDVGVEMVSSGLARDYTRYSKGYYKPFEPRTLSSLN